MAFFLGCCQSIWYGIVASKDWNVGETRANNTGGEEGERGGEKIEWMKGKREREWEGGWKQMVNEVNDEKTELRKRVEWIER